MSAIDIIMKKRGFASNLKEQKEVANTKEEIEYLISNYVAGNIPDYQMSSYLMAVYFNGMTIEEISHLTHAMLHSGDIIDLSSLKEDKNEVFVDKHSTGGVGDKISLPLAAIVASSGVKVPMMAGRALGYTGGTLDKLDSIEGYKTHLDVDEFKNVIKKVGFSIMGQTEQIAPADRLLYALRDVSGTVESIPLITSSILSKKLAEGADAFCFDVKVGSGAFMKTIEEARELANNLVNACKNLGRKACALITDMNIPLGLKIGNWLEIEEALDALEGKAPKNVMNLTLELASHMIYMGGASSTLEEALKKAKKLVENGSAFDIFIKNVEAQGGNAVDMLARRGMPPSKYKMEVKAERAGFFQSIDALTCGKACIKLGVGREKKEDSVFAGAGVHFYQNYGEKVEKGQAIMCLYGKSENSLEEAFAILKKTINISDEHVEMPNLIYETI